MLTLIHHLHRILNDIKGFDNVGYSGNTAKDGYMMLDYKGKRYAVKFVEIKNPSLNPFNDIDRLHHHI